MIEPVPITVREKGYDILGILLAEAETVVDCFRAR